MGSLPFCRDTRGTQKKWLWLQNSCGFCLASFTYCPLPVVLILLLPCKEVFASVQFGECYLNLRRFNSGFCFQAPCCVLGVGRDLTLPSRPMLMTPESTSPSPHTARRAVSLRSLSASL